MAMNVTATAVSEGKRQGKFWRAMCESYMTRRRGSSFCRDGNGLEERASKHLWRYYSAISSSNVGTITLRRHFP